MAPWYSSANHWGGDEFTVIILPVSAFFLNEQTMNQLNLKHLKEGARVKMKRAIIQPEDDAAILSGKKDEYNMGTVLSSTNDEVLVMWDGELFPCTTSKKFWHQISPA